jgi:hypothetical protein
MFMPSAVRRSVGTLALAALTVGALATTSLETIGAGSAGASVLAAKSCASYSPGKSGVTQTFCTGKGSVKITQGATTATVAHATCAVSGGFNTVNAGVVVGPAFKGAKPSYFGFEAPTSSKSFTNAVLAYTVNGTKAAVLKNTGTVSANGKSGTFTGTTLTGAAVSGSWSC